MGEFTFKLDDVKNKSPENLETLFALANGYIGVRASNPIRPVMPASVVNGFYESDPIIYGELAYGYAKNHQTIVNLYDLRQISVMLDGKTIVDAELLDARLEMDKGYLTEDYLLKTGAGQTVEMQMISFVSHKDSHLYGIRYSFSKAVTVDKKPQLIQVKTVDDDPRVKNQTSQLLEKTLDGKRQIRTQHSQLSLYFYEENHATDNVYTSLMAYSDSELDGFEGMGFDSLLAAQAEVFATFWEVSDITVESDNPIIQPSIRYNIFQLFQNAGRNGKTNFPAKGLTGLGYEGHYFWDTEMYLLPFFIYTQPQIAKALLTYRVSILPQAIARAKELHYAGALFAWRTINGEEASAYYPAGTAQVHINADIAHAFKLYHQVTGELLNKEVIYETARFWLSFGYFSEKGFAINGVTGPDEYSAMVNNNYYTNKMAQENLLYAVELSKAFGDFKEEAKQWQKAGDEMIFPYDEEKELILQDEAILHREVWDFEATPEENYPLLLHYHPMSIYQHRVAKQADSLLVHMLFNDYSLDQLKRDYDFYEPLTTHDSSLSRAIFSVLASKIGDQDKAYSYFKDSAFMDLEDMQNNAKDGIHAANMGGMWLGLIMGFAALTVENDDIKYKNHLPKEIKKMSFSIIYKGEKKRIILEKSSE
ncbi:glycoside hydrolase family 65 protein [Streptococcus parauberis]|uniref:glycoside hydrolase family 65 protein n=1 Tax=Streptococcus parauberis TaxID=1348 RepID=UPI000E3022FE|nr:glycoside hydrolase family 65 protein [Streptococcus parauberis]RFE01027.1 Alpha,alpha-trehalose phosphorylase [Streptococcus parauberis]